MGLAKCAIINTNVFPLARHIKQPVGPRAAIGTRKGVMVQFVFRSVPAHKSGADLSAATVITGVMLGPVSTPAGQRSRQGDRERNMSGWALTS
ncbi:MAG: hypothetical protein FWD57_02195 [Polyangiaceae bacterium]|nr:hypothetical protein [Polyangiaceae bacterium]